MEPEVPLSKKQQKRLRKQEAWEATLNLRKQKRKERKVKLREERKSNPKEPSPPLLIKTDKEEWLRRQSHSMSIIIDCDFYPLLTDKERGSLKQQLMFCYSAIRRSSQPCHFHVTGLQSPLLEAIQQVSQGNWLANLSTESFTSLFPKDELVYLTADADHTIDHFEENKRYIIGGLVDHNRLKQATFNKATELQIECAKLPIAEHLELNTTKILTVNHVVEIIMKFRETQDWAKSLVSVLPSRKKAKVKPDSPS